MFVQNFLNFIGPLHVRNSYDKVISICYGCIQRDFYTPSFQWVYYTYADLGGVTQGCFRVGCSSSVQFLGKLVIPMSKCKQTLAETLWVDVGGEKCESPSMDK